MTTTNKITTTITTTTPPIQRPSLTQPPSPPPSILHNHHHHHHYQHHHYHYHHYLFHHQGDYFYLRGCHMRIYINTAPMETDDPRGQKTLPHAFHEKGDILVKKIFMTSVMVSCRTQCQVSFSTIIISETASYFLYCDVTWST